MDDFEHKFPHRKCIILQDHFRILKGCVVGVGQRGVDWDYRRHSTRDGEMIEFGVGTYERWERFLVRFVARVLTKRADVF